MSQSRFSRQTFICDISRLFLGWTKIQAYLICLNMQIVISRKILLYHPSVWDFGFYILIKVELGFATNRISNDLEWNMVLCSEKL